MPGRQHFSLPSTCSSIQASRPCSRRDEDASGKGRKSKTS
jgi:hypothetical protein